MTIEYPKFDIVDMPYVGISIEFFYIGMEAFVMCYLSLTFIESQNLFLKYNLRAISFQTDLPNPPKTFSFPK